MADSLSTEKGRFDFYKKKLEEEKATVPELVAASPEVVELAMSEANRDIFPPMGFINFNKMPEGVDEEKFIRFKVDDILRGTVQYIHELESQPPAYLQGWGISNLPIYKESAASKELVAKTKASYSKLSEEMSNIEDGETPEFADPAMNKLTSKDISNLLDSSILGFLKEIGVQRTNAITTENDNSILESSQKIYDFLTKGSTGAQPEPQVQSEVTTRTEETVKIMETERLEPVATAPTPPAETPQAPQATPVEKLPDTVVEKSQPPIEPPKAEVIQPAQNVESTQAASIATPETANQPVSPLAVESSMESGTTSESSVSTPLLDMLANSSGMSSEEIAKMFQGPEGAANLQKSLDIPLPGSAESLAQETLNTGAPAAVEAGAQILNQTETAQVASKVSETVKMAEPIQPPATPAIQQEETTKPTSSEPSAPLEQKVSTGETAEKPAETETKTAEEAKNNDQGQTNEELLKVMRDVLKTLQGPLIVTDGKHNFS